MNRRKETMLWQAGSRKQTVERLSRQLEKRRATETRCGTARSNKLPVNFSSPGQRRSACFTDRGPVLWRVRACVSGTARRFNLCHGHAAIAQPAECQRVRRGSLTLNFAAARTSRIIAWLARALHPPRCNGVKPIGKFFAKIALSARRQIWFETFWIFWASSANKN